MPLIYIVEDDESIRGELVTLLRRNGFETACCKRFDSVVDEVMALDPSLVLLDLTLPGTDGQLICRELRSCTEVPIIVLTSRTSEIDEVMSMTMGADDFVPKPYRSRVLIARMEALLRRAMPAPEATILSHNGVDLDLSRSLAYANDCQVELTKNEMKILAALMSQAGKIVSRQALMQDLWESDVFVDDNTLTVNVNRLRTTLARIGVHNYLTTHRGRGYSV